MQTPTTTAARRAPSSPRDQPRDLPPPGLDHDGTQPVAHRVLDNFCGTRPPRPSGCATEERGGSAPRHRQIHFYPWNDGAGFQDRITAEDKGITTAVTLQPLAAAPRGSAGHPATSPSTRGLAPSEPLPAEMHDEGSSADAGRNGSGRTRRAVLRLVSFIARTIPRPARRACGLYRDGRSRFPRRPGRRGKPAPARTGGSHGEAPAVHAGLTKLDAATSAHPGALHRHRHARRNSRSASCSGAEETGTLDDTLAVFNSDHGDPSADTASSTRASSTSEVHVAHGRGPRGSGARFEAWSTLDLITASPRPSA